MADTTVKSLRASLCSQETPLAVQFRALFSLKHLATTSEDSAAIAAIEAIAAGFASPSALLKHELAYCLGQTKKDAAVKPLRDVLSDLQEDPMVRHEAAEALGALGKAENLDILKQFRDREGEDIAVKETCEIAIDRVEWENSPERLQEKLRQSDFASIDPAPPMPESEKSVDDLEKVLMDVNKPCSNAIAPYCATAVPAVLALAQGFKNESALFRHEIAFVFGQLSHPASIPALTAALSNVNEAGMVRHEAAEALGGLGEEEGVEDTLKRFLHDKETVVRESVIVALDMAEYEKSGDAEYALIPEAPAASA
ncbi:hypothetical protein ACCO45_011437 [Purpureocillium lilacinum]|uniref:Uncharacterized protein n=1 Tax=Purpureocillium lilacinum TaxID=33203 RepID=A0ACC4DB52_PURLI